MKNRVVVDASYALSWLLPDENKPLTKVGQKIAPTLLPYEVTNALKMAVLRGRINEDLAQRLLNEFLNWQINYQGVDYNEVIQIATRGKLSAYDASYVYLARKMKCELLTWDKKLVGTVMVNKPD